jgi:hypothetical protein
MISAEMLHDIAELIEKRGLGEALLTQLRSVYPGKHFTYCMDDDVHSGKPVLERKGFRLYLVNSQDHCSQITNILESASGIVLAEVIEE